MATNGMNVVRADDGAVANMGRRMSEFQWDRRESRVDYQGLVDEAKEATDHEHQMGILEAIRTYPKAVGWSVLASTALVMEGYDLVVIGSFYGYRTYRPHHRLIQRCESRLSGADLFAIAATFLQKYGTLSKDGTYQISAAWESGLSNGAVVGEILGLMITGIIADHFGYRFTIGLALVLVVS